MERRTTATLDPTPRGATFAEGAGRTDGSRRLQRMGAVTVGVSLPREWVGEHRLAVGSPVFLQSLSDGSLVVRTRSQEEEPRTAEIEVRVDRPREHLFRRLIAAYLDGAQEFRVHEPGGLSPETRAVARTFVRRTIQPEIVSEEGDHLLLRDVSRGRDLAVLPLLRRMHQIVLRLQEEAIATLTAPGRSGGGEWPSRDDEVDRHAWLIERILTLRSASFAGGPAVPQVLLLVRSLERTADHAVLIAEHGTRWVETSPPHRLVRAVSDFHSQARRLLVESFASAIAGDADSANDLLDTGEALHTQYRTLIESVLPRRAATPLPEAGRVELALLLQSIDRTIAYSQDMAEAGLDSGVRGQLGATSESRSRSSARVERGGNRER